MDIGAWLRGLSLGQYEATFREDEIEADVLPELTDQHLKDLSIPLGHRLKILRAIRELAAGEPLGNRPVAEPAPSLQGAAERRQLTVMFSDLVGSTALSARLDPEDTQRVIRAYQDAVSGVVARYDGFVPKFMGDGVLAYFGFPRAHVDDAARAVHAGLETAQVVAGLETPARENLAARVGVATGLVVVGDIVGQGAAQEQAVVGDTPNLAARLQGLADASEVVISAATRRLVGDGFRLRHLGRHAVKGLAEPVEAWSVLGVASTESRFEAAHASRLTGFVGRGTRGGGPSHLPAPRLERTRPNRADLRRGGHWQVASFGLGRRAGGADPAHPAALPMLPLSPRQRALSLRPAIRTRGGPHCARQRRGQARGAEAESGDFAAALTCLEQALVVSQRTGGSWFDAEVFRTRGDILIKQNPANPAPAEAAFRTAIAIAQSQKARSFELSAALALAKLCQSNGRSVEAQDVLGPALEGFSPTPEFPEIAQALNVLASIQPKVGG
jgi:class 3 adenylate cyclase